MNLELNEVAAKILVLGGYAKHFNFISNLGVYVLNNSSVGLEVDPFADTLEGRRQFEAVFNWVRKNNEYLWQQSFLHVELKEGEYFEWYRQRITWCLEQEGLV